MATTTTASGGSRNSGLALGFGLLFVLIGASLFLGGINLVRLGGSTYYLIAGLGLILSGVELVRQRGSGVWLYALVVLGTIAWSLSEVGLSVWGLLPRLGMFAGLGVVFSVALFWVHPRLSTSRPRWTASLVVAAPVFVALFLLAAAAVIDLGPPPHQPSAGSASAGSLVGVAAAASGSLPDIDWPHYGRTAGGQRYSPLHQITAKNVSELKVAWVAHTGATMQPNEKDPREFSFEATPIKVGDKVFLCTPHAQVLALDTDTGREIWRFDPHAGIDADWNLSCRGVSYYSKPDATGPCASRILTATLDAKLYAVDADTGARCADFGDNGAVDLTEGMGLVKPGFYYVTSPPQIVRGKAVVGGWVSDNVERGEPSGVVRAFDATTGKLAWAVDVGRPDRTGAPPPGETYTRGTPNVWTVMSADEKLGLVFLPTGSETPDFFGGGRLPASEKYGSSLIAVDADTGRIRWSFQTVHHDIWDFDLPSQPVLADIPEPGSATPTPVVVVPTKQGLMFILDRRDGRSITPIKERPVPQGAADGDWTSRTQPFPSGIPFFGPPDLTEESMWGMTPLDQLWCRIHFRSMRYQGLYTPPSTQGTISYPGSAGAFEWGSVSIDPTTNTLIANTSLMPMIVKLVPRDQAVKDIGWGGPAEGTPYRMFVKPFLSPAGVPCQAPPFAYITALDLNTRHIVWQHTLGTSRNQGPFGIPIHLPVPSGVPGMGGSLTTGGGLTFIGATADSTFRAFDTGTGVELWHNYLSTDAAATPMSYIGKDGRQYVVVAVGGHSGLSAIPGDSVVAYALPK